VTATLVTMLERLVTNVSETVGCFKEFWHLIVLVWNPSVVSILMVNSSKH